MILQHWKQAAVTLQGVEHISKEIPCQDKIGYYFDSNIKVIALADGAGSRKKAEYGAKAAVSSTCKYLGKEFYNLYMMCEETGKTVEKQKSDTENAKLLIISNAIKSITDIVEENCVIEDYASTLLFFACDGNKYICGHIGDGVIGVLDKKNELNLTVISEPENGGAPNITFFITDNNAIEHFRLSCGDMSDVQGVLLMSDGPEEVLYETNTKFNPNAVKILTNYDGVTKDAYEDALKHFCTGIISQYSYDDLSLNLLYMETIDTETTDEKYLEYIVKTIKNKEQIVKLSKYACQINDSSEVDRNLLSYQDALSYLIGSFK